MQYILIILLSIAIIFLSLLVKRLIRDVTLGLRATNKLIERYKSLRKDFDSMVEQNFEVKEYAKITNIPFMGKGAVIENEFILKEKKERGK